MPALRLLVLLPFCRVGVIMFFGSSLGISVLWDQTWLGYGLEVIKTPVLKLMPSIVFLLKQEW